MRFALLGPLEVRDDEGEVLDLGGSQPRTLLAVLVAARGRAVPTDSLIDAVWGETPPASAPGTLQTYISRLRRVLEPHRRPRDPARVLVSDPQGYRLVVVPEAVDAARFESLADSGRIAIGEGRFEDAVTALAEAEALWRGPAFAEYRDAEFARGIATRLEERRLAVVEQRLEAQLALGLVTDVAAEAAEAVRDEPLREGRWALLALSLYRSGRQAEALRALDEARRILVEELGVEPGRALRDLEAAILDQSPDLDAAPAAITVPSPGGAPGGRSLVGRDTELEALRAALIEAHNAPRYVVVEGEPGIGKTSLLEAIAEEARAAGTTVVWGRTHESGATPAYWPWLAALRDLVQERPTLEPQLAPLLDPSIEVVGPPAEAGPASFRMHEAVAEAIESAAAVSPIVIFFDDLQWADQASLALLDYLTVRLVDAPVLFGVTMRTLDVGSSGPVAGVLASIARRTGSRRLLLRGLDEADSGELLALATGREVAPSVASAIHVRSGGNPFFAGELVRLLSEEDRLDDADAVTRSPVPAGVRDVLRWRLDRLPEPTIELLRTAAVLGRDLEVTVLSAATERSVPECLADLEPATTQRLLIDSPLPGAAGRFAHALVREVLVEDMTTLRRAQYHLRAAEALLERDDDDLAELVAEHLWEALPLGVGERAAAAMERAAEVAVRRAAFNTAEDLLTRALDLRRSAGSRPDQTAAELATLVNLAGVTRSLHGYFAVLTHVDRGKELADRIGAHDIHINLEWSEWAAADTACDFARADPIAEKFRSMATSAAPDDLVTRMLGWGMWGIQCWHHGRITESAAALDASAEAAAGLPPLEHTLGIVAEQRALSALFVIHVHDLVGDLDDPESQYMALVRNQEDRFIRAMVASFESAAATAVGDLARANRASRAGLAADPDVAFSFWGTMNQMYLAGAMLAEGADPGDSISLFETGHARYLQGGTRTALASVRATMTLGLAAAGELEAAQSYLTSARDEIATYGERWPEPVVALAEADLLARTGSGRADVAELLVRAEALATDQGSLAVARRVAAAAPEILALTL